MIEQILDLLSHSSNIPERHYPPTAIGKHLLGIPVWCRDCCLTTAQGICECAGDNLLLIQIRCYVNVGRSEKFTEFLQLNKTVVKNHMVVYANIPCPALQRQTIPLTIISLYIWMGCS